MTKKKNNNLRNSAIAFASFSDIEKYGTAGQEFLKGLRGIDYSTGTQFDRSLLDISNYKINPEFASNNIKQQAGFSAEIASVSKRNADAIIEGSESRFSRSEDITSYGKNHNVVDVVEFTENGTITSQVKFVSDPEALARKIAQGEGGGKNDYSRYLTADKLEVPTEQVEQMKAVCQQKQVQLAEQADRARLNGNEELAAKLQKQSDNYGELEGKIADSKVTTEEAINYRLNPEWETLKDITGVSHQAGIEGAKLGVAIGGSISLVTNIYSVWSGDKEFKEAAMDVATGTLASGGIGYATTFTGTMLKTYMGQSSSEITRNLSNTGLPGMVVSTCLSTGKSIRRFVNGEIDGTELMSEIGGSSVGMVSGSFFTVVGQLAIPIPIVGGLIGGMIGYTLSNMFYYNFMDALKGAKISRERRKVIEMQCEAAITIANAYKLKIDEFFDQKLVQLDKESKTLFNVMNSVNITADEYCEGMNRFASVLGKDLAIKNMKELDEVMLSDKPLII